ncbi:hypothetical protein KUL72_28765 [Bradyrhizobium arachidis]|uniref:hypothetical protein n=1 Tax=Bradyrhizobium TaxID=374 RepID=UPI002163DFF3|nr:MULTISPECIES: hypothetical protein [Bradyrhizobium]MDN4988157.1 hypothetical protein [Bradyrhizobium sp. WYCCWR 13022]UVO35413.1 hypothetical protein KUL72_28765 [Bradyrhizobium arachidis]
MKVSVWLLLVPFSLAPSLSHAATAVDVSCAPLAGGMNAERATQFLDNPSGLLSGYPEGDEGKLSATIRDFATMRPETLEGIQSLSSASSPSQNRAIGAGLGTAAATCVVSHPATATLIQEAVLKTENRDLIQSFESITGDVPTNAVPGSDPNGESVVGGGRGSATPQSSGGVSTSDTTTFSGASTATTTTFFAAASSASTNTLAPISPTN